jgi:hypothetical protein
MTWYGYVAVEATILDVPPVSIDTMADYKTFVCQ